jgi:hypothetical protein
LLAGILAGCGSETSRTSISVPDIYTLPIPWPPAKEVVELKPGANGLVGRELQPVIPRKPPPKILYGQYWVEGIGRLAKRGDEVTLEMVGKEYKTGRKFYSSWEEQRPLTFTLGSGTLIAGLEHWIPGMEVGDKVEVVVPPKLATGASGVWKTRSGSTLVFAFRLLEVKNRG